MKVDLLISTLADVLVHDFAKFKKKKKEKGYIISPFFDIQINHSNINCQSFPFSFVIEFAWKDCIVPNCKCFMGFFFFFDNNEQC